MHPLKVAEGPPFRTVCVGKLACSSGAEKGSPSWAAAAICGPLPCRRTSRTVVAFLPLLSRMIRPGRRYAPGRRCTLFLSISYRSRRTLSKAGSIGLARQFQVIIRGAPRSNGQLPAAIGPDPMTIGRGHGPQCDSDSRFGIDSDHHRSHRPNLWRHDTVKPHSLARPQWMKLPNRAGSLGTFVGIFAPPRGWPNHQGSRVMPNSAMGAV